MIIVLFLGIIIFAYSLWLIEVEKKKEIIVDMAVNIGRNKGVEIKFNGSILEDKTLKMSQKICPGFSFEIRNERVASGPGMMTALTEKEVKYYLAVLNRELKIDDRLGKMKFVAEPVGRSKSIWRRCFVVRGRI